MEINTRYRGSRSFGRLVSTCTCCVALGLVGLVPVSVAQANPNDPAPASSIVIDTVSEKPAPPTNLRALDLNRHSDVIFTGSTDWAGGELLTYQYSVDGGNWTAGGTKSPISFYDLDNGSTYSVELRTVVWFPKTGAAAASDATTAVKLAPYEAPNAPEITRVRQVRGQLEVDYQPPRFDGGRPITSYEYQVYARGGTTFEGDVEGQPNRLYIDIPSDKDTYDLRIRAVNAAGPGTWSDISGEDVGLSDYADYTSYSPEQPGREIFTNYPWNQSHYYLPATVVCKTPN